ncbi:hypothetical protein [Actinoplanes sp. CA-252034]|uniref:hypothetical protein n=1 Tax=Actinoplanes sp. CA-252034 TaxID=3239906 RepID=UPI003D956711
MDELQWLMLVEWAVRLGVWLPLVVGRPRRAPRDPYAALTLAVRQLPAGGEAGGQLPDGTVWYVRMPSAGCGERRDGR